MDEPEIKTLIDESKMVDPASEQVDVHVRVDPLERRDHIVALSTALIAVIGVLAVGAAMGSEVVPNASIAVNERVVDAAPSVPLPNVPNPYDSLSLSAQAYIVYDVAAGKALAAYRADEVKPLASLTKMMTALLALENTDPSKRLAIEQYAIDTEGDSGLYANETWNLRDLVSYTMVTSSNDGADALAAAVGGLFSSTPPTAPAYERVDAFVDQMNARADQLGLENTRYRNATGLDEPGGRVGAEGSAEDMAKLIAYAWEHAPEVIGYTAELEHTFVSEDGFVHRARNTNESVDSTPGILASKTGYTDIAGGNLAILYDSGLNHPVAVVVLGSTIDGRFTDVQKLTDATYAYIESGWYAYEVAGSTPRT